MIHETELCVVGHCACPGCRVLFAQAEAMRICLEDALNHWNPACTENCEKGYHATEAKAHKRMTNLLAITKERERCIKAVKDNEQDDPLIIRRIVQAIRVLHPDECGGD